jgi:alanine racemase
VTAVLGEEGELGWQSGCVRSSALEDGLPGCAVVDLTAIRDNVAALKERAGSADVMAVVKADAYGHGLVRSARAAQAGGATWLGTAQLYEALQLRDAGVQGRMLSWLAVPGDVFAQALDADVDLGVSAGWALDEIAEAARTTGRTARVHVKVDTGLSRNGVSLRELPDLLDAALRLEAEGVVRLVGLFSHYAWADAPAHPTVAAQTEAFGGALELAERRGARLEVRHLANSAATLTNPAAHYDLVRPGLAVYGLSPVPDLGGPAAYGLCPAMTLLGRVALIKAVDAGAGVSYGHAYTTPAATTLALIPLGYADGLPRSAGGLGPVRLRGRTYTVSGRVCMDQVVLDLGDATNGGGARAGDVAVVFGNGTDGGPTAQDWAEAAGTISYEIVTRIGVRLPRRWIGEEKL